MAAMRLEELTNPDSQVDEGFSRTEDSTMLDGTVIRWKESDKRGALEISASKNGVMMQGYSELYNTKEGKDRLVSLLDTAYQESERLKDEYLRPGNGEGSLGELRICGGDEGR